LKKDLKSGRFEQTRMCGLFVEVCFRMSTPFRIGLVIPVIRDGVDLPFPGKKPSQANPAQT
jgi:hypothetical protein